MSKTGDIFRKDVIGWSLYDFANTIFSMNILSLYFKRWVVEDLGRDGLYYDIAYSGSMLLVGLIMPALGALSDHSHKKKLFLFLFTITCCISIGLVALIPAPLFIPVIFMFAFSNFFYEGGMVFYNSLLYSVSGGNEARLVSGFGVAFGYTGSIIGMILVLPWVTGGIFGLGESPEQRVEMLMVLKELAPDAVPVNFLNPVQGTRLEHRPLLEPVEALALVAVARLVLLDRHIILCGGREVTLRSLQPLALLAGASGLLVGDYLTTSGRPAGEDLEMLADLGLGPTRSKG